MEVATSAEAWKRSALTIRVAQLALNELMRNGTFKVPIHLALGHEFVALALAQAKGKEDVFILSHRNIHYQLALGVSFEAILAEALLREDGECGGTKGIMNMTSFARGNVYTSSILGNNLPVSCGTALAQKLSNAGVSWVVTGDGAIEEGAFAESLLLASSLGLPVIFVVEDNQWSLATHVTQRRFPMDVSQISSGYGCHYVELDGSTWESLSSGASAARRDANRGQPTVLRVNLETLGGRWVEDQGADSSGKRLINYHAGQTPDARATIADPIFAGERDPLLQVATELWFEGALAEALAETRLTTRKLLGCAQW